MSRHDMNIGTPISKGLASSVNEVYVRLSTDELLAVNRHVLQTTMSVFTI